MYIDGFRNNILLLCSWIGHDMRGIRIFAKGVHKHIGYLDGDIEIVKCGGVLLCVDELYDIRMIDTHHTHIGSASVSSLLNCVCSLGNHFPETYRPRGCPAAG